MIIRNNIVHEFVSWIRRNGNLYLCGAALLYVVIYMIFLPESYSIMDESSYLAQAFAFRSGVFYIDTAGISSVMSYSIGGSHHVISQYPPGWPFLLSIFSLISWKFALSINLFSHLLSFWIVVLLLRYFKSPVWFAVLYLCHPTAVLYSRTVMSDVPSGMLVAACTLFCLRRQYIITGVLLGIAMLVRTANVLVCPLLLFGMFIEPVLKKELSLKKGIFQVVRPALIMLISAIPFILAAFFYQKIIQDGGWARYARPGDLSLKNFPSQFTGYAFELMVLFPGMLFVPFFTRRAGHGIILVVTYGFLLLYSLYFFHDVARVIFRNVYFESTLSTDGDAIICDCIWHGTDILAERSDSSKFDSCWCYHRICSSFCWCCVYSEKTPAVSW